MFNFVDEKMFQDAEQLPNTPFNVREQINRKLNLLI